MSSEAPLRSLRLVQSQATVLRFLTFELDVRSGELFKAGQRVKIQQQPARVLTLLAMNSGRLLTRDEIRSEVWPDGTLVDFEQSLNFCIRQIRAVLGDQADSPRFVETLPRRGYRFIPPVVGDTGRRAGALGGDDAPDAAAPEADAERTASEAVSLSRRSWLLLWTALVLAAGTATWQALDRPEPARSPSFRRLTYRRGAVISARFVPGGRIAYVAAWEGGPPALHTASLENPDSRQHSVEAASLVAVSRHGEIAYLQDKGTLSRAPLEGGPAKAVLEGVGSADWTADGSAFAVARHLDGSWRIEFPIGQVLCQAVRPGFLRLSPDGRRLAFLERPLPLDDRSNIVVVDRSGDKRTLSGPWASAEGLAWSADGDEVWFTAARVGADSALHAVALDGRERTLVPSLGRLVIHDVAPDGRALLERAALRIEIKFGRAGERERDLSWYDLSGLVDLSADGSQVLFYESGQAGGPEYTIFQRASDGSAPLRLGHGRAMGLSPDGRWVLAIPLRQPDRIQLLPTGAGEMRELRADSIVEFEWAGWMPDGKRILFTGRASGSRSRVYLLPLEGGSPEPLTPEGVGLHRNTISPDGRVFVGYCGEEALCLYPLEGGEPHLLGLPPVLRQVLGWSDRRTVYVRWRESLSARIERYDVLTGRHEPWRELRPEDPAGLLSVGPVLITPDGSAWAYSSRRRLSDLYLVDGLD